MFLKLFNQLFFRVYIEVVKSKNGFDAMILKQLKSVEGYKGSCTATFQVQEDICNENNQMANGFSTTLVDTITSTGLSTLTFKKPHVTVTLNVEYYRPANIGDDLIITSNVAKLGKNLAFLEAVVKNRNTGDFILRGTHVKFIPEKTK